MHSSAALAHFGFGFGSIRVLLNRYRVIRCLSTHGEHRIWTCTCDEDRKLFLEGLPFPSRLVGATASDSGATRWDAQDLVKVRANGQQTVAD